MADAYDPPRIEERTDIGPELIGASLISGGVQG
jgi:hypothetical protein